jgi:spore maturation protein A
MLNLLWLGLILTSTICAIINGKIDQLALSVVDSAKTAFNIALGLGGIMTFWLGIMNIAKDSGLIKVIAKIIYPLLRILFPNIPKDHPAWGAMVMNIAANMLGLASAATPFGLKAMEELEKLNQQPGTATNAMCMFLAINTSSVQLIPASGIAFLAAGGATTPQDIVVTSILATLVSSIVGVLSAWIEQKRSPGY